MDGDVQYNEMGGGECTDAQENFQAGCSVSPPLRLGGMDGDLPRLQDYGEFPEKGGPQADGEAASGLTPLGEAMIDSSLEEVETYITRRKNTVAQ